MGKIFCGFCYLTCVILLSSCAAEGPFGLAKGMTLEQIDRNAQQIDHGIYTTLKVPDNHSSFKRYALVIGPKAGLCKIKAVSYSISTNSSGDQLRKQYERMKGRLETIYGRGETMDFVEPESMWQAPEHFMMGLVEKDRILTTIWEGEGGSTFTDDIDVVFLRALPTRSDMGFLMLEYEFAGFSDCVDEIYKAEEISSYDSRFY